MTNKRLGNNPFADSNGGLDALITPTSQPEQQTPINSPVMLPSAQYASQNGQVSGPVQQETSATSKTGLAAGFTRATFIVDEQLLQALKDKAYYDRKKLKDIVNEAFSQYLERSK